jgi:hypothetical protein
MVHHCAELAIGITYFIRRLGARRQPRAAWGLSVGWVYCGVHSDFLRESVAHGWFAVHSDVMSNSGSGARYYWCVRHRRVETDQTACRASDRLGPYDSAAEAEGALERVRARNEALDAEDARWAGEEG